MGLNGSSMSAGKSAPFVSALDLSALQPAEEQRRPLRPVLRGRVAAVCRALASPLTTVAF